MNLKEKKSLYESIMKNVSKQVKKQLMESDEYLDPVPEEIDVDIDDIEDINEVEVWVPALNQNCLVTQCYDADSSEDFYSVADEDGNYVCEIHEPLDLSDEDAVIDAIEDNADWENGTGAYEYTDPLKYSRVDDDEDEEDEDFDLSDDEDLEESFDDENEFDDYEDLDDSDMDNDEKYSLVGIDGNAFSVMGYVTNAMKAEGMSKQEISDYRKNAMSGDYNNLLSVSQEMINQLNEM